MNAGARLRYEPFERLAVPRPVDRLAFVAEACRDRVVLYLGAMGETAFDSKRGQGTWLHERIAAFEKSVGGIDNSEVVPAARLATGPNARIVRGDIGELELLLDRLGFRQEVVIVGELTEHVPNPLAFLAGLAATPALAGCTILSTTPNATAAHNVASGLPSRESTHRDYLCILSYKMLSTLCRRAGLSDFAIVPFRSTFIEMRVHYGWLRGAIIAASEKVVNTVEGLFPLRSFGWIVRTTFRR